MISSVLFMVSENVKINHKIPCGTGRQGRINLHKIPYIIGHGISRRKLKKEN